MFDVPTGTSGLTWKVVRTKLSNPDQWEPILAEELEVVTREPHRQQNAVPILLIESAHVPPAAAIVQKYEVYAGDPPAGNGQQPPAPPALPTVHRFSLLMFRAPMLFKSDDLRPISTAYHLMVVAQLFRFLIVEQDLKTLRNWKAVRAANAPEASRFAVALADLRRHLLLIDVETRRREFLLRVADFGSFVLDSLQPVATDSERDTARKRQARLTEIFNQKWMPLRNALDQAIKRGEPGLSDAVDRLDDLAKLNQEVLRITAEAYGGIVMKEYQLVPVAAEDNS